MIHFLVFKVLIPHIPAFACEQMACYNRIVLGFSPCLGGFHVEVTCMIVHVLCQVWLTFFFYLFIKTSISFTVKTCNLINVGANADKSCTQVWMTTLYGISIVDNGNNDINKTIITTASCESLNATGTTN